MRSLILALSLVLASAASASRQSARELFLSDIPASWKRAQQELAAEADSAEVRSLRVLAQLYGLGVPQDPAGAMAQAQGLKAEGQATAELLRHVGIAAAVGFHGVPRNLRVGMTLLDAAAAEGDDEAAALAGGFRLCHPKVSASGRAQLADDLAQQYTGGRAWLARAYELGRGGPADQAKAAKLLASMGAPDSATALARVALQRVEKADEIAHQASALPWLAWAAAAGSGAAAEKMADLFRGRPDPTPGIPRAPAMALRWYRRAQFAGHPGVSTPIRQLLQDHPELGSPEAEVEASLEAWARANVTEGFPEAGALMATAYHAGSRGLTEDPARAEAAYRALGDVGHPRAAELLAMFLGTRVMSARAEQVGLHSSQVRVAISGDTRARYAVGLGFTKKPPKDDDGKAAFDLAHAWLVGLCEGEDGAALSTLRAGSCTRLADLLERQGGGLDQLVRMRRRYERCADHGSAECAWKVAETYQDIPFWKNGPTEPDVDKERPWVVRAAKAGHAKAKERLAQIATGPGLFDNLGDSAMWGGLILLVVFGGLAIFLAGGSDKPQEHY
jgi:TPR repeat protein